MSWQILGESVAIVHVRDSACRESSVALMDWDFTDVCANAFDSNQPPVSER